MIRAIILAIGFPQIGVFPEKKPVSSLFIEIKPTELIAVNRWLISV